MPRHLRSLIALSTFSALSLISTARAQPPNVLFIAIDDLRNDLGSLGVPHAQTPQLDAFAATARSFSHHYVQVPTCGASRCALLRGRYPTQPAHLSNDGIAKTSTDWAHESLPGLFKQAGYQTLSLGKISHYPGNLSGADWNSPPEEIRNVWDRSWIPDGPWKTAKDIMHGYANGAPRIPGKSPALEAHNGPDDAYPDAWVAKDAIATLQQLANQKRPFFFGIGFFKPHLPFAAPQKWHDLHRGQIPDLPPNATLKPTWPSGWHRSGEFRGNYGHQNQQDPDTHPDYARRLREAYAASISYMDAQIGRVLHSLEQSGLADSTIVIIWSDHGFLLGEHGIWGKHCLYEHALRSPLMIRTPGLAQPGVISPAIVETIDILPTLAELCSLQAPADLDGHSLTPQLNNPATPSTKPARGYFTKNQFTIRDTTHRLIIQLNKQGQPQNQELFNYQSDPHETQNLATTHPEILQTLLQQITP